MSDTKVNCFKCRYFQITWDTKFPRSCKLYEFKSAKMPSVAILETTGEHCVGFELKNSFETQSDHSGDGWQA